MRVHPGWLQVQEAGLVWQLGLVASTVYHMGAAVLPFRARLLAVLDALLQAPSKVRPQAGAPPRGARAGGTASGCGCLAAGPAGASDISPCVFFSSARARGKQTLVHGCADAVRPPAARCPLSQSACLPRASGPGAGV